MTTHLYDFFPHQLRASNAFLQYNKRHGLLPAVFIRNPNDANIRYIWMCKKVTLKLRRSHLEPANFEDFLTSNMSVN